MLRQFSEQSPADPFPSYGYAMELRTRGRLEEAAVAFADMEARFPAYVPQYLMAVQTLVELRRPQDARAAGERGLAAARTKGDNHALGELQSALDAIAG